MTCPHPVEARVSADWIAICHDCRMVLDDTGEWIPQRRLL